MVQSNSGKIYHGPSHYQRGEDVAFAASADSMKDLYASVFISSLLQVIESDSELESDSASALLPLRKDCFCNSDLP